MVGSGPCGLFAAYHLALAGMQPIILERGEDALTRSAKVTRFFEGGPLDPECNVQFGEGGAGTFSDGKLNTSVKDPYPYAEENRRARRGVSFFLKNDGVYRLRFRRPYVCDRE